MTATKTLQALGACGSAVAWATTHGGTLADLWRDCPRGDWLLWYAARAGAPHADVVRAASACVELALPYAGETGAACERAIAAARAWADAPSEVTRRAASDAAYAAARAASDAADAAARAADAAARAVAYAARAASDAASDAARAAADAASDAADAAARAAAYAAYAAGDGARDEMRRKCADVVRAHVGFMQ